VGDYEDFNPDTRFVLVPEWQILGFDEKNAADAAFVGVNGANHANIVLDPKRTSR
jgi:hypothetical protein